MSQAFCDQFVTVLGTRGGPGPIQINQMNSYLLSKVSRERLPDTQTSVPIPLVSPGAPTPDQEKRLKLARAREEQKQSQGTQKGM